MKKLGWMLVLVLALCMVTQGALAKSIGIAVDDKCYVLTGDVTSFEADGKTFLIGENGTVTIKEPGKPDRVLSLTAQEDEADVVATPNGSTDALLEGQTIYTFASESEVGVTLDDEMENVIIARKIDGEAVSTTEDEVYFTFEPEEGSGIESMEDIQVAFGEKLGEAAVWARYKPYGITWDERERALYCQGQRVRVFEDTYPLDASGCSAEVENYDPKGVVDVMVKRDLTRSIQHADGSKEPGGVIVGVEILSGEAFENRDLSAFTAPSPAIEATYTGESTFDPQEMQTMMACYEPFGLKYDAENDRLWYQGKLVKEFWDVRKTNGQSLNGGKFQGTLTNMVFNEGEVRVEAIRDYTQKDENGEGQLIGMRCMEPSQSNAQWLEQPR